MAFSPRARAQGLRSINTVYRACISRARDITILYPVGLAKPRNTYATSQQQKQNLKSTVATNLHRMAEQLSVK